MRNELERLLDLANNEPGYAPEFYRAVLASDVFALIPVEGHGMDEGKLRFVMWHGADGSDVIPYFSSMQALENALQPGWQGVKLTGRAFLGLTRGATRCFRHRRAKGSDVFGSKGRPAFNLRIASRCNSQHIVISPTRLPTLHRRSTSPICAWRDPRLKRTFGQQPTSPYSAQALTSFSAATEGVRVQ